MFALGMWPTVMVSFVLTPLLTLLLSSLLYRFIEAPAIAYGKRLFNEPVDYMDSPHEGLGA